jgi:aryl-alcohol dehydrogenase-like predicted oxidoreductase
MAQALGIGVLPWSPLRSGQLSGKYVRDNGTPADSRRSALIDGPTEQGWDVIEAVARVAAELGVSSAEVALAWVRGRPTINSTLIGARTLEQLRSNLASLQVTLAPEQLAALEQPSAPSLDFPARLHTGLGPMLGLGGTTVDGVEQPTWPALLESSARLLSS